MSTPPTSPDSERWEDVRSFILTLCSGLTGGYFYSVCRSYVRGLSSGFGVCGRFNLSLQALRSKAAHGGCMHFEAGSFAACWATYRVVESSLARHHGKEDRWNSIIGLGAAGGLGLGIFQLCRHPALLTLSQDYAHPDAVAFTSGVIGYAATHFSKSIEETVRAKILGQKGGSRWMLQQMLRGLFGCHIENGRSVCARKN